MNKTVLNRVLAVVTVVALMAAMMSFVFGASAATTTLIDGITDAYFTRTTVGSVGNMADFSTGRTDGNVYRNWDGSNKPGYNGSLVYTSDVNYDLSESFDISYSTHINCNQGRALTGLQLGNLAIVASNSRANNNNSTTADSYSAKVSVVDLGDDTNVSYFRNGGGNYATPFAGTVIGEYAVLTDTANVIFPETVITVAMTADGKLTVKAGGATVVDAIDISSRFDLSDTSVVVGAYANDYYWGACYLIKDFKLTKTTADPSSAPVSSEPTSSAPVSSEPTSSAPVSSEPTSSAPVSSEPTSSDPVSSEPTSSAPVSSEPTSSAPVSSDTTSSDTTSSQPDQDEPGTEHSLMYFDKTDWTWTTEDYAVEVEEDTDLYNIVYTGGTGGYDQNITVTYDETVNIKNGFIAYADLNFGTMNGHNKDYIQFKIGDLVVKFVTDEDNGYVAVMVGENEIDRMTYDTVRPTNGAYIFGAVDGEFVLGLADSDNAFEFDGGDDILDVSAANFNSLSATVYIGSPYSGNRAVKDFFFTTDLELDDDDDTSSGEGSSSDVSSEPEIRGEAPISTNKLTALGLASLDGVGYKGNAVMLTDAAFKVSNSSVHDGGGYIVGKKYFDLSKGFTLTWTMGDSNYNCYNKTDSTWRDCASGVVAPYNSVVRIGDLAIIATRGHGTDNSPYGWPNPYQTNSKYMLVRMEEKNDTNVVLKGPTGWNDNLGVAGTLLASADAKGDGVNFPVSPFYANPIREYKLVVAADGKLTLYVDGTKVFDGIDSGMSFANVNFGMSAFSGYSGGVNFADFDLKAVGAAGGSGSGGSNVDSGDNSQAVAFLVVAIVSGGALLILNKKKAAC